MLERSHFVSVLYSIYCALLLTCGLGCDSDEDSSAPTSTFFSIEFLSQSDDTAYVVLQNSSTDSVFAMEMTAHPGSVTFENTPLRATVTIANIARSNGGYGYAVLHSYRNVPLGSRWYIGQADEDEPAAQVSLDISYPAGDYSLLLLGSSSAEGVYELSPWDTAGVEVSWNYCTPNDAGLFSVFGCVMGDESGYLGWNLDRPFVLDALNSYSLGLNKPGEWRTVSVSQQVEDVVIEGIRLVHGEEWFPIAETYWAAPWTPVEFLFHQDLPMDRYLVWTYWYSDMAEHDLILVESEPPDEVVIPDIALNVSYDSASCAYCGISVTESVDILTCAWDLWPLSMWGMGRWYVTANGTCTTISPPVLPDSLLTMFGIEGQAFEPDYIEGEEYGHTQGYDQYIWWEYANADVDFADMTDYFRVLKEMYMLNAQSDRRANPAGGSRMKTFLQNRK